MQARWNPSQVVRGVSALALISLGGLGLRMGGLDGAATAQPISPVSASDADVAARLAAREIGLGQRRHVQQLLKEFTLGQMTRHYWGGFAGSLMDLGLESPDVFETRLQRDGEQTSLLIRPLHGDVTYWGGVARHGSRLTTWACQIKRREDFPEAVQRCPEDWTGLDLTIGS